MCRKFHQNKYSSMHLPLSRIFVGMSGGVDSSVAAFLLKKAGHEVIGVFMKNWEAEDRDGPCPAAKDLQDAQAVCDLLSIELQIVNFSAQYWERVFAYFLDEYRAGRTPNPDVLCNREIKFKAFLDYAKQQGADYIATGHYARALQDEHTIHLLKGNDPNKDQSYFLYALDKLALSYSLFPIGHLRKSEVRAIAREIGCKNHDKKDSTGICFIGERKFKTFLNNYLPARPGMIESVTGEVLGTHDGLMFYTIGQRQGLQIGGKKGKPDAPWYAVNKDLQRNVLIVAQGTDHPALYKSTLIVNDLHWINPPGPMPLHCMGKARYRQEDQACIITPGSDKRYHVEFIRPQRAIAPGQSMVFYREDICLGGGMIE